MNSHSKLAQRADDPLTMIASVMKAFKGDWKSPDAVTVVRSANFTPVNKIFKMSDSGDISKVSRGSIADAVGIVVGVPDVHAFGTLLELIGEHPSTCLISGRFPAAPGRDGVASDPFRIMSSKKAMDVDLSDGWGVYEGMAVTTRSLLTTASSNWVMFDCDFPPEMPPELSLLDYEKQWWPAMVEIFPGLADAGRVYVPSSTSRLLDADGQVVFTDSPSSHTWVQINDPSHVSDLRSLTLYTAAKAGKAFMRENKAGAAQLWTIFDPSTFSRERLVFEGSPTSKIEGYTIAEPDIVVVDGGRFDTRAIPELTNLDYQELSKDFNVRFERARLGGSYSMRAVEHSLSPELLLTLRDVRDLKAAGSNGPNATLFEIHASVAHLENPSVRCQMPFRESDSWAATVYLGNDRMPFLNDFGSVHLYRIDPSSASRFPEKPYADNLRQQIRNGDTDAIQFSAATYAAVLFSRGEDRSNIRSKIGAIVKQCLNDDPNCYQPDLDKKKRNDLVCKRVKETLAALEYTINSAPGGTLFELPTREQVVEEVNERFVHAILGKKAKVIREIAVQNPGTQFQAEWLESGALKEHLGHEVEYIQIPGNPNPVPVNPFKLWLTDQDRNTADGVEFRPEPTFRGGQRAIKRGGTYNLWQGMLYGPEDNPELDPEADIIEEHIRDVISAGDAEKYEWMMDWFAANVQDPACQGLCIPVWKSREGTGKNTITETIFSPLFGWHYFEVSRIEHLTGNFNALFGLANFVVGNEAIWGGDRQSAGALKTLIDVQRRVEFKFSDAIMMNNFAKVLLFTNEDWFAPENLDSRRLVPFDVSAHRIGDFDYFERLRKACIAGRGVFLRRLLERDINWRALRTPPGWSSSAGLKNKLSGETAFANWLYNACATGTITVPESKLTLGTYNLVRVADHKVGETDLEVIPHMLDDRLEGSTPNRRSGVVRLDLTGDGCRVSTDVLYQSYLHFATTAQKPHKFAGSTMDFPSFGKALLKLANTEGRGIARKVRIRAARYDRFAGHSAELTDYKFPEPLFVYEIAPLDQLREAFQGLSRIQIEWEDDVYEDESEAEPVGSNGDHCWEVGDG